MRSHPIFVLNYKLSISTSITFRMCGSRDYSSYERRHQNCVLWRLRVRMRIVSLPDQYVKKLECISGSCHSFVLIYHGSKACTVPYFGYCVRRVVRSGVSLWRSAIRGLQHYFPWSRFTRSAATNQSSAVQYRYIATEWCRRLHSWPNLFL